jgi:hypothetical protein
LIYARLSIESVKGCVEFRLREREPPFAAKSDCAARPPESKYYGAPVLKMHPALRAREVANDFWRGARAMMAQFRRRWRREARGQFIAVCHRAQKPQRNNNIKKGGRYKIGPLADFIKGRA